MRVGLWRVHVKFPGWTSELVMVRCMVIPKVLRMWVGLCRMAVGCNRIVHRAAISNVSDIAVCVLEFDAYMSALYVCTSEICCVYGGACRTIIMICLAVIGRVHVGIRVLF